MTRVIMVASATLLLLAGAACLFIPEPVATALGYSAQAALALQIASAGLLGFAMLNWTARGGILGGIYGRPVVAGNVINAGVLTIVLVTAQVADPTIAGIVAAVFFATYWAAFARLLFGGPVGRGGPSNRQA